MPTVETDLGRRLAAIAAMIVADPSVPMLSVPALVAAVSTPWETRE
jgi:hypothetical protein